MFIKGQSVACVNDEFSDFVKSIYRELPVKDGVYTVRDVEPGINENNKDFEIAIRLEELTNPLNRAAVPVELAFNAERFVPLTTGTEEAEEEESEPTKERKELVEV